MIFLFAFLLFFTEVSEARSLRTVRLSEKDLETIYVEPGYSTLIKFDSHPEPGLIGDQDAFKVEYMKNMVAIKPLFSSGKTNLFLFTKEGQFNFQLVAGKGRHDNIVHVQAGARVAAPPAGVRQTVLVDDLLTRKLGIAAVIGSFKITLDSIATPVSRTTLVLRLSMEQKGGREKKIGSEMLSVTQGKRKISIENIFLESKKMKSGSVLTTGLLLLRIGDIKKGELLRLEVKLSKPISLPFSADFGRR